MKNFSLLLTAALSLALSIANPVNAQAQTPRQQEETATSATLQTTAKQAYIYDATTGQVLFEKNADERMPTSSMSKAMTVYALFDALKRGEVTLDDTFNVSEYAWRKGGSKMFVDLNSDVRIEDLIRGITVQSGNDATIVVAEGLAGTEGDFADAITAKARTLGMTNTSFMNASGWPDPDHYSTARDLGTLAARLHQDFPEYYHFFSEKEFTYNGITQRNRNPLLYRNIGADGLKTGHTEAAGYGLIATASGSDRRVVLVVNGLESESERAQEASRLMEWALRRFVLRTVLEADKPIAQPAVLYGKAKTVNAGAKEDLKLSVPRVSMGSENVKTEIETNAAIKAPVKTGDKIGTIKVTIADQQPVSYPLYALEDVPKSNIFSRTLEKLIRMISGQES